MKQGVPKNYVKIIRKRYQQAGKANKSMILDQICESFGCHRKYIIRSSSKVSDKDQAVNDSRGCVIVNT